MAALSLASTEGVVHPEGLDRASQTFAKTLGERPWSEDFYLAGSAALALYLDHRPVRNLDLMTAHNRLTSAARRDLLTELLALDDELRVETARDGYLYTRRGCVQADRSDRPAGGAALKLFYYPYPLVEPTQFLGELAVASPVDLGLMKLGAIISRGTKRDFVDLYLLCRHLPLAELLERSDDKFGHVRDFPLQALKGLADRSLTEGEPLPRYFEALEWPAVEAWVDQEIRRLSETSCSDGPVETAGGPTKNGENGEP